MTTIAEAVAEVIQANTLTACRVTTTSAITLSGTQTIDGVAVVAGERCLVRNQADTTTNGIYLVQDGAWTRASDLNGPSDIISGAVCSVTEGTVYGGTIFQIVFSGTLEIGVSQFTFVTHTIETLALLDDELAALYAIRSDVSAAGGAAADISTAAANIQAIIDAPDEALAAEASAQDAEAAALTSTTNSNALSAQSAAVNQASEAAKKISSPRIAVDGYAEAYLDKDGRVIQGIGYDGKVTSYPSERAVDNTHDAMPELRKIGDLSAKSLENNPRKTGLLPGSIVDEDGRALLQPHADGTLELGRKQKVHVPANRRQRTVAHSWTDEANNEILTFNLDGSVDFYAGIHTKSAFYTSPETVSDETNTFRGLEGSGHYDTIVSQGGFSFEARRMKAQTDGSATVTKAVLAKSTQPLTLLPLMGQSNAGKGNSESRLFDEALFRNHVMFLHPTTGAYGDDVFDSDLQKDVQPALDQSAAHHIATLAGYALEGIYRSRKGETSPGVLVTTSWRGGQNGSYFIEGTNNFENLVSQAEAALRIATHYGREIQCPRIYYYQGESGVTRAQLSAIADRLTLRMQTALGLSVRPKLVVIQVNAPNNATGSLNTSIQDIYDEAQSNANIEFLSPAYDATFSDGIHNDSTGKLLVAERVAIDLYSALEGDVRPEFDVASVTATDKIVTVTFNNPYKIDNDWFDANASDDLSGDGVSSTVSGEPKLFGVTYGNFGGNSIVSYTRTSDTVLTLTLANNTNSAGRFIDFGRDLSTVSISTSFSRTRTNLYMQTGYSSYFHKVLKNRPDLLRETGRLIPPEETRTYVPIRRINF